MKKRKRQQWLSLAICLLLTELAVILLVRVDHSRYLTLRCGQKPVLTGEWASSPEETLLFNGSPLPRDGQGTYYIPQNPQLAQWEGALACSRPGVKLLWAGDDAFQDKAGAIAEGHPFTLYLERKGAWAEARVVFTGLPVMVLESESVRPNEEGRAEAVGRMTLFDPSAREGGSILTSRAAFRIRGAKSAADYPKVGFKLDLENEDGSNRHEPLLGMAADDDWIIRSLYTDPQKVREQVAAGLWNALAADSDANPPCSDMQCMELFVEGEYYGLVGLMQRTDGKLLELSPEDILYKSTVLSLDVDWESAGSLTTLYSDPASPDPAHKVRLIHGPADGEQWEPLHRLWEQLYTPGHIPDRQYVQEHCSLPNLIDFALFKQVCYAVDNEPNNMFLLAQKDGEGRRFHFLPWDMDYTFGNAGQQAAENFSEFRADSSRVLADNGLLEGLIASDPDRVIPQVQERWAQLRGGIFDTRSVTERFAQALAPLLQSGAFARDARRWPGEAADSDLSALTTYMTERLNFLDSYINGLGQEW